MSRHHSSTQAFQRLLEFVIVTDHQALQYLDSMRNSNPRLMRWALALQPFMFTVKHRPGVQNGNADGLSRQAWTQDNQPDHHCFAAEEGGGKCWESPPNKPAGACRSLQEPALGANNGSD